LLTYIDIRPENFLLTFDSNPIKLNDLLLAEQPNKKPRKGNGCLWDEGNVFIYDADPLVLVPKGQLMDLKRMVIKIVDLGSGTKLVVK
jgi:hypothetical protein